MLDLDKLSESLKKTLSEETTESIDKFFEEQVKEEEEAKGRSINTENAPLLFGIIFCITLYLGTFTLYHYEKNKHKHKHNITHSK